MMTLCDICLRDAVTGGFGRAHESVMMLASVDDDDDEDVDDDNNSDCASGFTLSSVWGVARSQMAGCLRDSACEPLQPAWGFSVLGRLPTKVTVSRTEDGSGNEFNISAADSCNLIVPETDRELSKTGRFFFF